MTVALFIFFTLLLMHLCTVVYVLAQKFVGESCGAEVEVVGIGTNIFLKPIKVRWGPTLLQFGVLPISGFTKFSDDCMAPHKGFRDLTPTKRVLVLVVGPTSSLLLGIGLLWLAVSIGAPQISVGRPVGMQEIVSAVPGLAVENQLVSIAGQQVFVRDTFGEFCLRIATFRSMKDWGGPIAWIMTCGNVGAISSLAWVSCASLLMVANGVLNLLPIPSLNGGHIFFAVWESILGRLSEPLELRLTLIGLLSVYAILGYVLILDLRWLFEHFLP